MTDARLSARLGKFKRQAGKVTTQAHLDRIVASFPVERRAEVFVEVVDKVSERLELKAEVEVVQVKPQGATPNVAEETVQRLNDVQRINVELRAALLQSEKEKQALADTVSQLTQDLTKALSKA